MARYLDYDVRLSRQSLPVCGNLTRRFFVRGNISSGTFVLIYMSPKIAAFFAIASTSKFDVSTLLNRSNSTDLLMDFLLTQQSSFFPKHQSPEYVGAMALQDLLFIKLRDITLYIPIKMYPLRNHPQFLNVSNSRCLKILL